MATFSGPSGSFSETNLPIVLALNCIEDTTLEQSSLAGIAAVEHAPLSRIAECEVESAAAVLIPSLAFLPAQTQRRLKPHQLVLCLGPSDQTADRSLATELNLPLLVHIDSPLADEVWRDIRKKAISQLKEFFHGQAQEVPSQVLNDRPDVIPRQDAITGRVATLPPRRGQEVPSQVLNAPVIVPMQDDTTGPVDTVLPVQRGQEVPSQVLNDPAIFPTQDAIAGRVATLPARRGQEVPSLVLNNPGIFPMQDDTTGLVDTALPAQTGQEVPSQVLNDPAIFPMQGATTGQVDTVLPLPPQRGQEVPSLVLNNPGIFPMQDDTTGLVDTALPAQTEQEVPSRVVNDPAIFPMQGATTGQVDTVLPLPPQRGQEVPSLVLNNPGIFPMQNDTTGLVDTALPSQTGQEIPSRVVNDPAIFPMQGATTGQVDTVLPLPPQRQAQRSQELRAAVGEPWTWDNANPLLTEWYNQAKELLRYNFPLHEVAKKLNRSEPCCKKMLKMIRDQWIKTQPKNLNLITTKELVKSYDKYVLELQGLISQKRKTGMEGIVVSESSLQILQKVKGISRRLKVAEEGQQPHAREDEQSSISVYADAKGFTELFYMKLVDFWVATTKEKWLEFSMDEDWRLCAYEMDFAPHVCFLGFNRLKTWVGKYSGADLQAGGNGRTARDIQIKAVRHYIQQRNRLESWKEEQLDGVNKEALKLLEKVDLALDVLISEEDSE